MICCKSWMVRPAGSTTGSLVVPSYEPQTKPKSPGRLVERSWVELKKNGPTEGDHQRRTDVAGSGRRARATSASIQGGVVNKKRWFGRWSPENCWED